jgi:hypothetical protein
MESNGPQKAQAAVWPGILSHEQKCSWSATSFIYYYCVIVWEKCNHSACLSVRAFLQFILSIHSLIISKYTLDVPVTITESLKGTFIRQATSVSRPLYQSFLELGINIGDE